MADLVVDRALAALAALRRKPVCDPAPRLTDALAPPPVAEFEPGSAEGLVKAPAQPPPLPLGVRLVSYKPKAPPVAVTVCSVVTDVPKFIEHWLAELAARLHAPIQIRAGDSVFELLSKLADCGLELALEWPPSKEQSQP